MNRISLSLAILAWLLAASLTGSATAQEINLGKIEEKKSIDIRKDKNADNLFMIIFFARKANLEENSLFGHAYMATLIFESDSFQPTGVFGLYPTGNKKWVLGRFNGGTDLTKLDSEPDAAFLVWVNRDAYNAVLEEREKWEKQGSWILALRDCVSMMEAVAKVAGLKTPAKNTADFPYTYLKKLISAN